MASPPPPSRTPSAGPPGAGEPPPSAPDVARDRDGRARTRLGRIGEQMAVRHLEAAGMAILDRNWRCRVDGLRGELDIVARDGDVVVACEVKTLRRATPAGPLEGITPRKLVRLRRLAAAWLAAHPGTAVPTGDPPYRGLRIDAVGVSWPPEGGRARITHLRGIDGAGGAGGTGAGR